MAGPYGSVYNQVTIANLALLNIGSTVRFTTDAVGDTIPTSTTAGRACSEFFDQARVAVLLAHDWDFARFQVGLADSEDDSTPPKGWEHLYLLPNGSLYSSAPACIAPRSLWSGKRVGMEQRGERIPFELYNGNTLGESDHQAIVTDFEANSTETGAPFLTYTGDVNSDAGGAGGLAQWPTHFAEAVAWALSARIAIPLSMKQSVVQTALAMERNKLLWAIAMEKGNRQPDVEADSEFITSRN